MEGHLGNPVHVALFTGCSFSDEKFNDYLSLAFVGCPERYHYALLAWPHLRGSGRVPSRQEMQDESAKYLRIGVRPIWHDDHGEIPGIIERLK
jgi:hypothetical protein